MQKCRLSPSNSAAVFPLVVLRLFHFLGYLLALLSQRPQLVLLVPAAFLMVITAVAVAWVAEVVWAVVMEVVVDMAVAVAVAAA